MSSKTDQPLSIFWFRRDLRLHDNAGLYHALKSGNPVLCLFIFDKDILDDLHVKDDRRVTFIYETVMAMRDELREAGSELIIRYGTPEAVWKALLDELNISQIFTNTDHEVYARDRDEKITKMVEKKDISFHSFKDQVIFEKREILTGQDKPYTVFTPYSRTWLAKCNDFYLSSYPTEKYAKQFAKTGHHAAPSLADMGFQKADGDFPGKTVRKSTLEQYAEQRDFPAITGTTHIGMHLRFGTVSIRTLARNARAHSKTWLNELIWRDFYQQILWNFPHIGEGKAFRPEYDRIKWRSNEKEFKRWCEGTTGYPLVDAGMREINATGFMHNRVRMVTASFLSKHLLMDWRLGEAYFAEKLLDYDLAANNGGWQWAAGSGTDAAPYFRIFNPTEQAKKFDKNQAYIRKWIPEYGTDKYPEPMVDHKFARERCLKAYKDALNS